MKKSKRNLRMTGLRLPVLVGAILLFSSGHAVAQNQQKTQQSNRLDKLLFNVRKSSSTLGLSPVHREQSPVETPPAGTTYTFTGRGGWNNASNWDNNLVPPVMLKHGDHVVINGSGPCLLNNTKPFLIGKGSIIEIKEGGELYVAIGNNFILKGNLTNNGKLSVLSGTLVTGFASENPTASRGQFKTTAMSKIGVRKNSPGKTRND